MELCPVGIEAYHLADGTTGRCLCDHRVDGLCTVDSNDVANLVSHRLATPDELVDPEFCRHQHGPNDELRWLRHDGDDELHDDHPFARLADDYYSLNYWGYSTSHLANIDRTSCNDPSNVDGARGRLRHDEHPSWCSPDDPWCMDYTRTNTTRGSRSAVDVASSSVLCRVASKTTCHRRKCLLVTATSSS